MDPNDPLGLGIPDEDDWVYTGPVAKNSSTAEPVESPQDAQANISYFFEEAVGIQDPIDRGTATIKRRIKRPLRSYNRYKAGNTAYNQRR
ncbi:hypothetical protein GE21DRAFT_5030 [Neurospora crassa]|uniref:Uncharacterized protein n=1 Tax=Neurospora crassa (strain ATCC 24698 / 74-OR23-1A / CBS 708.71 / DSM 1257 / FGSC 987) TaxID=367110 RepID=Q7S3J6_NEUCR|nr:hypothetical protein NCU08247 [Neurospora crassa OR74A]EAA30101.1 hypothetical protein NCU08247 [Neurospora crassa OR74A]KHE86504.1 hypothetical protein GE21DRAFT_5030 [Neurospora crassa]|eukprot:XP_959337.1 hypothetical protein NCU08247 [Neurospora crassa OR74A]